MIRYGYTNYFCVIVSSIIEILVIYQLSKNRQNKRKEYVAGFGYNILVPIERELLISKAYKYKEPPMDVLLVCEEVYECIKTSLLKNQISDQL
ncbi:hypothetical protein QQE94_08195 [Fervidobacterium pennivorans subsp. shakshaketiis]|uniref:hypothetical protein n=1 Tax=Fervidobacterium pennivorans TaxID=93466 RepID=UPI001436B4D3|nr:hypothetical protein [Fervidobacterium pennivorans]QIV78611.1 hypothetical protein HER11_06465 [Fervidobacterium pennivorans subsp. keratinolyticus]